MMQFISKKTRRGFKLWVTIADVSHYVRPGTAIDDDDDDDDDAYERGTSTLLSIRIFCVADVTWSFVERDLLSLKPKVDLVSP